MTSPDGRSDASATWDSALGGRLEAIDFDRDVERGHVVGIAPKVDHRDRTTSAQPHERLQDDLAHTTLV